MLNQDFVYDTPQNLANVQFTKLGYDFLGWSTSSTGSVEYTDEEEVINLVSEAGGHIVLYAVWEERTMTVSNTITFDNTSKRTEFTDLKQVWQENGITVTNNKDKSTNVIGNYSNPVRFYKSSNIVITMNNNISKIVINCNTTDYATALKGSTFPSGVSVSASGKVVTILISSETNSITISGLSAQVRVDSMVVTYETSELEGLTQALQSDKESLETEMVVQSGNIISLPSGTLANGTVVGEWTANLNGYINLDTLEAISDSEVVVILTTTLTNSYYSESFSVEVTIKPASVKIADNLVLDENAAVKVVGTVVALSTKGFIIQDDTAAVFVYQNATPTVTIGSVVEVSGVLTTYNKGKQITNPTISESTLEAYTPGSPKELTIAEWEAYLSNDSINSEKVVLHGIMDVSGTYYNIVIPGTSKVLGAFYFATTEVKNQVANGNLVIIEGYTVNVSSSKYVNIIVTNIEKEEITISFDLNGGTGSITSISQNSGASIIIPDGSTITAPEGMELSHWTDADGNNYALGATVAINESVTLVAVWDNGEVELTPVVIYQSGFESSEGFTASTTYNNTSAKNFGPSGKQWAITMGTPSTTDAMVGSQSLQCRAYNTNNVYGVIQSKFIFENALSISFASKYETTKATLSVQISTDGSSWTEIGVATLTTSNKTFNFTISTEGLSVYLKFVVKYATAPTKTSRVYFDTLVVNGYEK